MGKLNRIVVAAALAAGMSLVPGTSQASTAQDNLIVTVNVNATCSIVGGTLDFTTYDPTANDDKTGTLTVTCSQGAYYSVSLGNGNNYVSGRRMTDGSSHFLNYELYNDTGRTTVWNTTNTIGNGASGATGSAESLTVYGRIPSGQAVPNGTYQDTVIATITY